MDIHATTSERPGLFGVIEALGRRFRTGMFLALIVPLAFIYVFCVGVSLIPGVTLFNAILDWTANSHFLIKNAGIGIGIAATYFSYGLTIIFVVPVVNKLLPLKVKPCRTTWYDLSVIPWLYHNALTYLVRYTFLDFITPSPMNKLFYQMMGMKIGKGSMINTSNISDPCLIEIGDYVTVGGSATLVAHYGQKGFLIIDKLVIKDKATIGLKASLFGNVVVGKGALVKAHEVVMPKTRIPDAPPKDKKKKEDAA